jgi:hypothetical protein
MANIPTFPALNKDGSTTEYCWVPADSLKRPYYAYDAAPPAFRRRPARDQEEFAAEPTDAAQALSMLTDIISNLDPDQRKQFLQGLGEIISTYESNGNGNENGNGNDRRRAMDKKLAADSIEALAPGFNRVGTGDFVQPQFRNRRR